MKIKSTFFKQNPLRQYQYTPRYYDKRKERLEKMMQERGMKLEEHSDGEQTMVRRTKDYRAAWSKSINTRNKQSSNANKRVIIIAVLLVVLAYWYIQSK